MKWRHVCVIPCTYRMSPAVKCIIPCQSIYASSTQSNPFHQLHHLRYSSQCTCLVCTLHVVQYESIFHLVMSSQSVRVWFHQSGRTPAPTQVLLALWLGPPLPSPPVTVGVYEVTWFSPFYTFPGITPRSGRTLGVCFVDSTSFQGHPANNGREQCK